MEFSIWGQLTAAQNSTAFRILLVGTNSKCDFCLFHFSESSERANPRGACRLEAALCWPNSENQMTGFMVIKCPIFCLHSLWQKRTQCQSEQNILSNDTATRLQVPLRNGSFQCGVFIFSLLCACWCFPKSWTWGEMATLNSVWVWMRVWKVCLTVFGPVINWRLVWLRPETPGMDSINPCDPQCGISGDRKWIDGWMTSRKCESLVCKSALVVSQSTHEPQTCENVTRLLNSTFAFVTCV